MLFVFHPKFCIIIVFSFSWGHFNSQEILKTVLMQNFRVTNEEHYGMLWYFWRGQLNCMLAPSAFENPSRFNCRSMWAQLQDQIKIRTKRLASAAEIHGFNRDLNELIARLQEKDASLSMEDLGRDMASVQGLQRKHEGHERDLVVVQKQVETLSAQSAKLQVAYQGEAINMVYFLHLLLFYTCNLIHQD